MPIASATGCRHRWSFSALRSGRAGLARNWLKGAALALVLVTEIAVADAISVTVTGRDADFAARFAGALSEMLEGRVTMVTPAQAALRVALDEDSFRQALESDAWVIGVEIPRDLALRARREGCRCTALFAGPDPRRQLRLIRKLLPVAGNIGLLLQPDSGWVEERLGGDLVSPPVAFDIEYLGDAEQLGPALTRLLPRVDALLATREPSLYNAATAKLVLLSSYRQGKPVIGPNAEFVRAGSLATTYSSGYDLVASVGGLLQHFAENRALPSPDFPDAFSVTVNEHVARAYDLVVRDPQWLASELRREEAP